jgi:predicted LPLAT superfamily acyltransferase
LGESAAFPQGPFILASLLECPVFLLFALHNGEQYNIVLEPFSEKIVLPRRQRETLLQTVIQQYAARLEHYCRLTPLQWFNFYNFWQRDE